MEELKKIHVPDVQDPMSVSINVLAAYAMGRGTLHGR
jgi:hypothetical protein